MEKEDKNLLNKLDKLYKELPDEEKEKLEKAFKRLEAERDIPLEKLYRRVTNFNR